MSYDPISQYIESNSTPENEILKDLFRETHVKALYPRMLSGHIQGLFLKMISQMIRPRYVLEIGTYTGYSAICLSEGLAEGGKLITIEINDEITYLAKKYFEKTGTDRKIKMVTGNALEIIPAFSETFDLVFIDAEKSDYISYYELVMDKLTEGGYILADNVLWDGKVINTDTDKDTTAIKNFNDHVKNDQRVENIILSIRDGINLIRKKKMN